MGTAHLVYSSNWSNGIDKNFILESGIFQHNSKHSNCKGKNKLDGIKHNGKKFNKLIAIAKECVKEMRIRLRNLFRSNFWLCTAKSKKRNLVFTIETINLKLWANEYKGNNHLKTHRASCLGPRVRNECPTTAVT